jgi:tRNA-specific 2-thiouridylase
MKKKVMLAMSGGVDSSVALLLLKEKYDVVGVTLKLFENETIGCKSSKTCCSLSDVEDAKSVAARCGVDHYTFNFKEIFKDTVIKNFTEAYLRGETPNPCIDCNRYVKFDEMLRRAVALECDYLATGHYARIEKDEKIGRYLLKKALDETKDQSYVLYNLTQDQLSKILFPMGEMRKTEARELADSNELVNANKPDSQDICFVPDGDYAKFIEEYTGVKQKEGNFVDFRGNILGKHKGISHYTIGQRKGLGIALGKPVYVVGINPEDNTVILGDESELMNTTLIAKDVNLISIEKLDQPIRCKARTRYKQIEQPCTISQNDDGTVTVIFDEPQRAFTPGQAVVFYDDDIVIGGGTIV